MSKQPEGKDWQKFLNELFQAEHTFKGTEEEFEVLSAQMMVDAGYDPVEAREALRTMAGQLNTELFKDALVIHIGSEHE